MPPHKSDNRLFGQTGIYLMGNFPFVFKCKFGITDHIRHRRRNVSETTDGAVFTIAFTKMLNGHSRETFVHALYFWANAPFKKGSGRSEWFLNVSPVVGMFGTCFALPEWLHLALFITPVIWLDGLFWLLVFTALDWVFIALAAGAVIYGLTCL